MSAKLHEFLMEDVQQSGFTQASEQLARLWDKKVIEFISNMLPILNNSVPIPKQNVRLFSVNHHRNPSYQVLKQNHQLNLDFLISAQVSSTFSVKFHSNQFYRGTCKTINNN